MKIKKHQKLPKLLLILASFIIISANSHIMLANALPLLIIDPGHGGKDLGVTGLSGIYEKDLNLIAASALKDALSKDFKVIMTRTSDYYLTLSSRKEIINKNKPDLLISIHHGALFSQKDNKLSIGIFFNEDMDKETKKGDPQNIQKNYRLQSIKIAEIISKEISGAKIYKGPYKILEKVNCPAILIELQNLKSIKNSLNPVSKEHIDFIKNKITKTIKDFFY